MAVTNPYQSYQQNSVTQSTPGELTLMLYNGCIEVFNQAKGIETNNIELRNTNIQKAQAIIREFMITSINLFQFLNQCPICMSI
jgi:flagellar protein FliS